MSEEVTLQVGVKVLLQNEAGQFLLLRRSLEKYPEASGRWDIAGGRINPGTPLFENLAREVQEETGLALRSDVSLLAAQDILRVPGRHIVRLTYLGTAEGEIHLDPEEHDDFGWYTQEDLTIFDDLDVYLKEVVANL